MGSDAAAVSLRQNGGWKFCDAVGFVSSFIGAELTDIDSPYSLQAITTRDIVIVKDVSCDEKIVNPDIRALGVSSTLLAPMFIENKPLGVIFFNYKSRPHHFTDDEIEFAKELAQTAAIAYYNAELFEQARLAQAEVQRARQKIQRVLDGVTDGVLEIGPDWKVSYASETASRILGSPLDKIHGTDLWDLIQHSSGSGFREALEEAMLKGEPVHIPECITLSKDKWIECHCYPFEDGVSIYFQDTTEKRKADSAANYLAALVESSSDAIISKGLDGLVTSWNHGAEVLFGYTSDEMLGKPLTIICPPGRESEMASVLDQIRSGHKLVPFETERLTKDGRTIEVSVTVSPIRNHNGEIVGASKISHFIGVQKELERQIRQQSELLAEQSKRKDEFLAMLSHELRNPLAPIQTAVQILKKSHPDLAPVETIDRQVHNMTKLVDDLLEVSRALSGRLNLQVTELSVNEVVRHAMEASRPLIESRHHNVKMQLLSQDGWVMGDRTRLEEVLVNLLNNAAKYTPDGGMIEVEVTKHHDQVQIAIRDNGIGIDDDLKPVIFELFTQAERSLDRSEGGLGIGLSLVHKLVEMHNGTIEVVCPPPGREKGSEFRLTLPAVQGSNDEVAEKESTDPECTSKLKIMVVDDNVDLSNMLSMLLEMHDHIAKTANNGIDGLELARQWKPDVILLDIGLPGASGLEVAKTIRQEIGQEVLLIALTGYGRKSDLELTAEAGFDGHLVKPFDYAQLEMHLNDRFGSNK